MVFHMPVNPSSLKTKARGSWFQGQLRLSQESKEMKKKKKKEKIQASTFMCITGLSTKLAIIRTI